MEKELEYKMNNYEDEYEDIEIDDEYEIVESDEERREEAVTTLSVISKWFIRIGIVIMVFLLIYFVVTGNIINAMLYIVGLFVAFCFGYFFMYFLDYFVSKN